MRARRHLVALPFAFVLVLLPLTVRAQQNACEANRDGSEALPPTGKVRVEADWPVQPKGLSVYLDPGVTKAGPRGKFLGETPLKPMDVPIGKHTLTVWLESRIIYVTTIDVSADGETRVLFPVKDSLQRSQWVFGLAAAERLQGWCDDGEAEECVNAGHMWLHGEVVPNIEKALIAYEKGCELNQPFACFAWGYLRKRHHWSDSRGRLAEACRERPETCWYSVLPNVDGLKDPTEFTGRRSRETAPHYVDIGTWFRVGAGPSTPVYTSIVGELDFGSYETRQSNNFSGTLFLGLTHQTANIMQLNRQGSYRLHTIDITVGFGYSYQPWKRTPFYVRMGVLADISVLKNTSKYLGIDFGLWGSLGYRWGRHRFDAGGMLGWVSSDEVLSKDPQEPGPIVDLSAAPVPFLRYTFVRSW